MSIIRTRLMNLDLKIKSGDIDTKGIPDIFNKISYPTLHKGESPREKYNIEKTLGEFTDIEFGFTQNNALFNNNELMREADWDKKFFKHIAGAGKCIEDLIKREGIKEPYRFLSKVPRECLVAIKSKTGHEWDNVYLPFINCYFGVFTYDTVKGGAWLTQYAFKTSIYFLPNKK